MSTLRRPPGELVGEPDVDVAVGRLGQLGELGGLGRAEVPDAVRAVEVVAVVELEGGLVERDGLRRGRVVDAADELRVAAEVVEDPAAEDPLRAVADEEVVAEGQAGPFGEGDGEPVAGRVHGDGGLVADERARPQAGGDRVRRGIERTEVGPGVGVDDQRHDHDDDLALGDGRGGVDGGSQRAVGDDLGQPLVEVGLAGEGRDTAVDRGHGVGIDVGADDLMPGSCELHGEGKTDLPEGDDADVHLSSNAGDLGEATGGRRWTGH